MRETTLRIFPFLNAEFFFQIASTNHFLGGLASIYMNTYMRYDALCTFRDTRCNVHCTMSYEPPKYWAPLRDQSVDVINISPSVDRIFSDLLCRLTISFTLLIHLLFTINNLSMTTVFIIEYRCLFPNHFLQLSFICLMAWEYWLRFMSFCMFMHTIFFAPAVYCGFQQTPLPVNRSTCKPFAHHNSNAPLSHANFMIVI